MSTDFALLRRVLDRIHQGGNIFYIRERFDAYKLVALIASNARTELKARA